MKGLAVFVAFVASCVSVSAVFPASPYLDAEIARLAEAKAASDGPSYSYSYSTNDAAPIAPVVPAVKPVVVQQEVKEQVDAYLASLKPVPTYEEVQAQAQAQLQAQAQAQAQAQLQAQAQAQAELYAKLQAQASAYQPTYLRGVNY